MIFLSSVLIIRVNGEEVRLMLWDTAGQEEFDAITKAYYRGKLRQKHECKNRFHPCNYLKDLHYVWEALMNTIFFGGGGYNEQN